MWPPNLDGMAASILIPDKPSQSTVSAIRSLHRAGDSCDVMAPRNRLDAWFASRTIRRWLPENPFVEGSSGFGTTVSAALARHGHDVLMPMGPLPTLYAAEQRNVLTSHAALLVPTPEVFVLANDKWATHQLCERIGVPVPMTFELGSEADVAAAGGSITFPAVIKPRTGRGAAGLSFVGSERELRDAWQRLQSTSSDSPVMDATRPIVQEFIPGTVHDVCAVAHGGELVNALTQERILMRPIAGGIGAIDVSTDEPELRAHAAAIIEALGYEGPLQIEFKRDPGDGTFKLLEINPRFWGTLDFSIRLGMDFPGQVRDLALGRPVRRNLQYPVGARYRFYFPQSAEALLQLARVHGWRSTIGIAKGRRPAFRDFDPRDPLPDIRRAAKTLRRIARDGAGDGLRNLPADLVPRP